MSLAIETNGEGVVPHHIHTQVEASTWQFPDWPERRLARRPSSIFTEVDPTHDTYDEDYPDPSESVSDPAVEKGQASPSDYSSSTEGFSPQDVRSAGLASRTGADVSVAAESGMVTPSPTPEPTLLSDTARRSIIMTALLHVLAARGSGIFLSNLWNGDGFGFDASPSDDSDKDSDKENRSPDSSP